LQTIAVTFAKEMGRKAAEILISSIEKPTESNFNIDIKLDTSLIIREST